MNNNPFDFRYWLKQVCDIMVTIKGITIPNEMANVLKGHKDALYIFEIMRPSCQRIYVSWIKGAKNIEEQEKRLNKLIDKVLAYGQRHPEYK